MIGKTINSNVFGGGGGGAGGQTKIWEPSSPQIRGPLFNLWLS